MIPRSAILFICLLISCFLCLFFPLPLRVRSHVNIFRSDHVALALNPSSPALGSLCAKAGRRGRPEQRGQGMGNKREQTVLRVILGLRHKVGDRFPILSAFFRRCGSRREGRGGTREGRTGVPWTDYFFFYEGGALRVEGF